jgi:cytochrome c-type biogenesis protein CcmH
MRKQSLSALLVAGLLLCLPALLPAKEAQPASSDPAAERRMRDLALELRCLVCQNQTIADSEADLASDLRKQILEQIAAGRSDAQIKDFMVSRYGDFILYRPPVKNETLVLWFGPGLMLAGGLLALFLALRRRNARIAAEAAQGGLSDDEARRAQHLLSEDAEEGGRS